MGINLHSGMDKVGQATSNNKKSHFTQRLSDEETGAKPVWLGEVFPIKFKFIAFISHTHCYCAVGLHYDIRMEAVKRDCLSIHILLENMTSNLQFFVKGRVNESHEQTLDIYFRYFNVSKSTKKRKHKDYRVTLEKCVFSSF